MSEMIRIESAENYLKAINLNDRMVRRTSEPALSTVAAGHCHSL
jgi:hypothetical protein